ncbi:hypothetical protein H70357_28960 [Paenibacillus sp. FSL H7-0357]|uniref:hypothetical protein n=1 Tax=unclassified Paenibacillus TaxID=185978 RepID=UPI0004F89762|nr:hypothetical protein [Paenibacillus sp. FSL H7-0357]AIQ20285.1 hypothetical protein H70357_28960 [Paenibacillus sp. FSL H7-0357]
MSTRSLIKFQLKDYRRGSLILLSVLVLVDIAMVLLLKFLPSMDAGSADNIFSVNRNIITIFSIVSMIVTVAITFPLMSSFSVTRRNFYVSTLLALLGFCISAALAESILYLIGRAVLPSIGLPVEVDRPLLLSWYMFTLTLLEISMATFLIGSCFYRFKLVIGIFSAIIYFGLIELISLLLPSLQFMDVSALLPLPSETFQPGTSVLMWVITALFAVTGWLVYRRTDIRM